LTYACGVVLCSDTVAMETGAGATGVRQYVTQLPLVTREALAGEGGGGPGGVHTSALDTRARGTGQGNLTALCRQTNIKYWNM